MRCTYFVFIFFFILTPIAFCQTNIIDKIQQLQPSIVSVQTSLTKIINIPDSKDKRTAIYTRTGAGVIIDSSGIIVTNTHTIINAPSISVVLNDGRSFPARLIIANLDYDFSLLKIDTPEPLIATELANSNSANLGEPIVAIGSSELNQNSLLAGEISSLVTNRSSGSVEFVEVNLSLYRGDSGGPVFDRNGRLLGIIMAKHKLKQNSAVIIAANKIRELYWHSK